MACVRTGHEIELQEVLICGLFVYTFINNDPWEWSKGALMTFEEATKSYVVEVIAESHFRSSN
jgi:hypothetical protein